MYNLKEITNTIINDDCLNVMKDLPDKCIDLVLTDPPYGIGISKNPFRQKFKKENWDNKTPTIEYFNEIFRVSKEQVIWGGNYFDLPVTKGFFIWDKVQPQNFSSSMCEFAWSSKQSPAKLFKKRVVSEFKYHPTTKPLELMKWCLSFFPNSKLVLDPFLGSGTTAVASQNLKRNFIGIEKEAKYCEIAKQRLRQQTLI